MLMKGIHGQLNIFSKTAGTPKAGIPWISTRLIMPQITATITTQARNAFSAVSKILSAKKAKRNMPRSGPVKRPVKKIAFLRRLPCCVAAKSAKNTPSTPQTAVQILARLSPPIPADSSQPRKSRSDVLLRELMAPERLLIAAAQVAATIKPVTPDGSAFTIKYGNTSFCPRPSGSVAT